MNNTFFDSPSLRILDTLLLAGILAREPLQIEEPISVQGVEVVRSSSRSGHPPYNKSRFHGSLVTLTKSECYFALICTGELTMTSGLPRFKVIFPDTATVRPSYCCVTCMKGCSRYLTVCAKTIKKCRLSPDAVNKKSGNAYSVQQDITKLSEAKTKAFYGHSRALKYGQGGVRCVWGG